MSTVEYPVKTYGKSCILFSLRYSKGRVAYAFQSSRDIPFLAGHVVVEILNWVDFFRLHFIIQICVMCFGCFTIIVKSKNEVILHVQPQIISVTNTKHQSELPKH